MYCSLSSKRVLDLCCLSLLPILTVLLLHINTNIYWHLQVHTHTFVISILYWCWLSYLGGCKYTILSIFLPYKNMLSFSFMQLLLMLLCFLGAFIFTLYHCRCSFWSQSTGMYIYIMTTMFY